MADYGLKISQPFYDATKAADSNLIFNSSWPTLPIAAEATFVSSAYGGTYDFSISSLSWTHGLGFSPLVVAWATRVSDGNTIRYFITSDTTKAYLNPNTGLKSIHVVCYNIDITVAKDYPYLKTSGSTALYDNDYGIKIAKEGADITSTDMRDFILHSRCQSPQVLAIVNQDTAVLSALGGGTYDIFYTPPVATTLWAFGFVAFGDSKYQYVDYYSQSTPRLFVNSNSDGTYTYQLNFGGSPSTASLIILRDPMFTSNTVNVSY
jgi:hypothetical protein